MLWNQWHHRLNAWFEYYSPRVQSRGVNGKIFDWNVPKFSTSRRSFKKIDPAVWLKMTDKARRLIVNRPVQCTCTCAYFTFELTKSTKSTFILKKIISVTNTNDSIIIPVVLPVQHTFVIAIPWYAETMSLYCVVVLWLVFNLSSHLSTVVNGTRRNARGVAISDLTTTSANQTSDCGDNLLIKNFMY